MSPQGHNIIRKSYLCVCPRASLNSDVVTLPVISVILHVGYNVCKLLLVSTLSLHLQLFVRKCHYVLERQTQGYVRTQWWWRQVHRLTVAMGSSVCICKFVWIIGWINYKSSNSNMQTFSLLPCWNLLPLPLPNPLPTAWSQSECL